MDLPQRNPYSRFIDRRDILGLPLSFPPLTTTGGTPVDNLSKKNLKRVLNIQIMGASMLASEFLLLKKFQLKFLSFQRVTLMTHTGRFSAPRFLKLLDR